MKSHDLEMTSPEDREIYLKITETKILILTITNILQT